MAKQQRTDDNGKPLAAPLAFWQKALSMLLTMAMAVQCLAAWYVNERETFWGLLGAQLAVVCCGGGSARGKERQLLTQ